MDNATFYKNVDLQKFLEKHGHQILCTTLQPWS